MTTDVQIRSWRRRLVAVAVAAFIAVVGIAISWRVDVNNRRSDSCQSQVHEQDNDRAMWLYLLEQNPTNPKAPEFRVALDSIIPPLKCVRGSGVPIPDIP